MKKECLLSICIVNWNTVELLRQCLISIYKNAGIEDLEILVVDNNSNDYSVEMVRKYFPEVRLIVNTTNLGFAKANNQMLRIAQGKYSLLLNSDTIVLLGAIKLLIKFMDEVPLAGACGPKLLNEDFTYQRSFMDFPTLKYEIRYHLAYNFYPFNMLFKKILNYKTLWDKQATYQQATKVNVIPGASFLVRMTTYRDIGPMAEEYFLYSEENDWCWRMREKGWHVYYIPAAKIIHLGGKSSQKAGNAFQSIHFCLSRQKFINKTQRRFYIASYRIINLFFWSWIICVKKFLRYAITNKVKRKKIDEELKTISAILSVYLSRSCRE